MDKTNEAKLMKRIARHEAGKALAVSPSEGRMDRRNPHYGPSKVVLHQPTEGNGTFLDRLHTLETRFVSGERQIGDCKYEVIV